jgi:hypothetical protein
MKEDFNVLKLSVADFTEWNQEKILPFTMITNLSLILLLYFEH